MTKGKYIADIIRNSILNNELRNGEKLPSEAELCKKYDISRTSVRTAIQMLSTEGLINTYHGKGSFVSNNNDRKCNIQSVFADIPIGRIDMFEFRRAFEAESAALAANRATESEIEALREYTRQMQQAQTSDIAVDYDFDFHHMIATASKNAIMPIIFDMLMPAYRKMFLENVACRGVAGYKEHLQILSAIESRNPEQAKIYMIEHLNASMVQLSVKTSADAETELHNI